MQSFLPYIRVPEWVRVLISDRRSHKVDPLVHSFCVVASRGTGVIFLKTKLFVVVIRNL